MPGQVVGITGTFLSPLRWILVARHLRRDGPVWMQKSTLWPASWLTWRAALLTNLGLNRLVARCINRVGKGPASTSGVNLLSAWYLLREGLPVPPDSIQMWLSMGRRVQLLQGGTGSKAAAPLSKGPLILTVRLPQRLLEKDLQKMAFHLPRLSTNNDLWIKTFLVHKYFCAFIFLLFFCSVNFCLSRCQKDPDIRISWSGLDGSSAVRVAVAQQGRLEFTLLCCV